MKHLGCIFLLYLCIPIASFSQYSWFHHYEGPTYAGLSRLTTDIDNNLYTCANFDQGITIGTTNLMGRGSALMKYAPNGELLWYKRFTYSSGDFWYLDWVKTDNAGNVYVVGMYGDLVTVENVTLTGTAPNSFLAKFNSSGELQFLKKFEHVQQIFHLAVNGNGEIAITAPMYNSLTLDGHTVNGDGVFGALLDTDGNAQWLRLFNSSAGKVTWPTAVTLGEDGKFYFNGRFSGKLKFDDQPEVSNIYFDVCFFRLNRAGECEWIASAERGALFTSAVVEVGDLEVDASGNLYAYGQSFKSLKIGSQEFTEADGFSSNFYCVRFDADGQVKWVDYHSGGQGQNFPENVVLRNGKVFLGGIYQSQPFYEAVDMESGAEITPITAVPLTHANGGGSGFAVSSDEKIYMSGQYHTTDFNKYYGFLFKLGPYMPIATTVEVEGAACKGNTISLSTSTLPDAEVYEWEITIDGNTSVIQTTEPSLDFQIAESLASNRITVRVHGFNADANGEFSPLKEIQINPVPSAPEISLECNELRLVKGNDVTWFRDGAPWTEAVKGQSSAEVKFEGEYYVVESNSCGSATSNKIDHEPIDISTLFIPNIITPNDDGKNERFELDSRLAGCYLQVSSRWGPQVFESSNYQNTWNGSNVSPGIYFYQIKSACLTANGTLTVVK
jgi:hypothetical protein